MSHHALTGELPREALLAVRVMPSKSHSRGCAPATWLGELPGTPGRHPVRGATVAYPEEVLCPYKYWVVPLTCWVHVFASSEVRLVSTPPTAAHRVPLSEAASSVSVVPLDQIVRVTASGDVSIFPRLPSPLSSSLRSVDFSSFHQSCSRRS